MSQRIIVPLLVLLALAPPAVAQQQRGPRFGFGRRGFGEGIVALINMREVQRELGVSAEQRELLEALRVDLRTQWRVAFRRDNGSRRGGPQNASDRDAFREKIRAIEQQGEEMVLLILEDEQAERLQQIRLQQDGTRAFERAEVAKELELTEAQLSQIREIRKLGQEGGVQNPSFEQRRAQRQKVETDVLALLNDKQKQKWEQMQGKKFQFPSRFARNRPNRRRPPSEEDGRERE